MELSVYNIKGQDTGRKVQLNDDIYGIEPNEHVMYLAVRQYLADQRQGTHKSKERSELSGSTRKLFRQKGTGGARRGDINSPLLRGGARVFGPKPRDYSFKLNKKVKVLARKSALSPFSMRLVKPDCYPLLPLLLETPALCKRFRLSDETFSVFLCRFHFYSLSLQLTLDCLSLKGRGLLRC